jgi:pyruvate dehydrogenase E2 component (dihydrolipoamide acetyltransferase)
LSDFTVPELGENVAGGDVAKVLVKVGDTVRREQSVIELETDKATVEVPSSLEGVITDVKVKKGDKVTVGQVIFTVSDNGAAGAGAPSAAPQPAASAPAAAAAPPAPAPQPEPRDQKVVPMPQRTAPEPPPPASVGTPLSGTPAPASPAVRRLAREIGVDINTVMGTGPGGRISQEDVKEHARRILSSVGSSAAAALTAGSARATRPLPDFAKWGEVAREPWTNVRRVTSEHLSYAWTTIPHVTQFDKADATALEELRKKF